MGVVRPSGCRRVALGADLLDVLPIELVDAQVSAIDGRLGISLAAMDLLIAAHAVVLKPV